MNKSRKHQTKVYFISRNGWNKSESEVWIDFGENVLSFSEDTVRLVRNTSLRDTKLNVNGGRIFISSRDGTSVLDMNEAVDKTYLKGLHITKVRIDREGGHWFATISRGVFYSSSPLIDVFEMGPGNSIIDLIKNGNDEIIAIGQYLNIYKQISEGDFKLQNAENIGEAEYTRSKLKENGTVEIEGDDFSLSVQNDTILRMDNGLIWKDLDSLYECKRGGGNVILRNKQTLEIYRSARHPRQLRHFHIYSHKNVVYIPTLEGLYSFNRKNGLINFCEKYDFPAGRVNGARVDKKGNIWVASNELGLFCWDGTKFMKFNDQNPKYGDMCRAIELGDQYVWASTEKGLLKVDLLDYNNVEFFTKENGLLSNEIRCIYVDDEFVFLGHGNGVTQFPIAYEKNNIIPLIYIDGVRVDGKNRSIQDSYTLQYNEGHLSIDFTGVSYNSNVEYKYRLKSDAEDDWNYTKERNVVFVSIPPGSYSFEVVAIHSSGLESTTKEVSILVLPPFWATISFKIIFWALIALIIYVVFRVRLSKVKNKIEQERKVNDAQQQALRAQMNPHFIFNALNSVQAYILSNDKRKANRYLALFSNLVRSILDLSSEKLIPISEEIKVLTSYLELEVLRFKEKLTYEISISEELNTQKLMIPPILMQPYVENAIWHGILAKVDGGKITIAIRPEKTYILCVIEDNGIGREEAKKLKKKKNRISQSVGMKITANRIDLSKALFNVDFSVNIIDLKKEDIGIGTRVEISIPYLEK